MLDTTRSGAAPLPRSVTVKSPSCGVSWRATVSERWVTPVIPQSEVAGGQHRVFGEHGRVGAGEGAQAKVHDAGPQFFARQQFLVACAGSQRSGA